MVNQIKFIYLSQDEYDGIQDKNDGALYFTSDTHKIYKGSTQYTGSGSGQDAIFDMIQASGIKVNDVDVSLDGHRHNISDIDGFSDVVYEFNELHANSLFVGGQEVATKQYVIEQIRQAIGN